MRSARVIIESRRTAAAATQAAALEEAGLHPIVCTGPTADGGACPLVVDEPCPVLDEADVILYDLDLDREDDLAVLRSLVAERPDLPVVTERGRGEVRRHADDLRHVTVVPPISPARTAAAVVAALAAAAGDDPG